MNDRHEPEKWRLLCELASREQDSSKLIGLISELNRALDESLNLKMRRVCATQRLNRFLPLPSFFSWWRGRSRPRKAPTSTAVQFDHADPKPLPLRAKPLYIGVREED